MPDLVDRDVKQVDIAAGGAPALGVVEVQAAVLWKEPVSDDSASAVKRGTVTVVTGLPANVDVGGAGDPREAQRAHGLPRGERLVDDRHLVCDVGRPVVDAVCQVVVLPRLGVK